MNSNANNASNAASANRYEQQFDGTVHMAFITQEEVDRLRGKLSSLEEENARLNTRLLELQELSNAKRKDA